MRTITEILKEALSNTRSKVAVKLNEMAAVPGTKKDVNGDEKLIEKIGALRGKGSHEERFNRASNDPNHHLHPKNYTHAGSNEDGPRRGGGDVTDHETYRNTGRALARALDTIGKKDKKVAAMYKSGKYTVKRAGATAAKVNPAYASLGGRNSTSRADIEISSHDGKHVRRISVKQGSAQLASAEGGEFRALGHHAAESVTKNEGKRKEIKSSIDKISSLQKAAKTTSDPKKHAKQISDANRIWNSVRTAHPKIEHHIAHEAAFGHHKFGEGNAGSADHMVTYNPSTGESKVTSPGDEIKVKKMEIRKGKGKTGSRANPKARKQRDHAFRIDI